MIDATGLAFLLVVAVAFVLRSRRERREENERANREHFRLYRGWLP